MPSSTSSTVFYTMLCVMCVTYVCNVCGANAGCTNELGCTLCADPLLTSVRRSGYRTSDPRLPFEEDVRELSITLPFGTKSPESFADAEAFIVCSTKDNPLKNLAQTCEQGLNLDESWKCSKFPATHVVCVLCVCSTT